MSSQLKLMQMTTGKKYEYHAHCGVKAQIRNLRHKCAGALKETGSQAVGARVALVDAFRDEPNAEFGRLLLLSASLDAAAETGETWITCVHYFLGKFEERREQAS